jgi:hypothetical protein
MNLARRAICCGRVKLASTGEAMALPVPYNWCQRGPAKGSPPAAEGEDTMFTPVPRYRRATGRTLTGNPSRTFPIPCPQQGLLRPQTRQPDHLQDAQKSAT